MSFFIPVTTAASTPVDLTQYALKTDIPVVPSLTGYATVAGVNAAIAPLALASAVPSIAGLAKLTDIPAAPDLTPYAKASDVAPLQLLGTYTVATLPPATKDLLNRRCLVTDLFGNRQAQVRCLVTDLFGNRQAQVRCEGVTIAGTTTYYWQPQSSDSSGSVDVSGANTTLGALTTATSTKLIGSITAGVSRTVTLADAAFPGQVKEVFYAGTLGVGSTLNLAGSGLASAVAVLAGGYQKYVSDWTTSPGSRIWVRLV